MKSVRAPITEAATPSLHNRTDNDIPHASREPEVSSVLAHVAGDQDVALVMDTNLEVEGGACALSFLLVPEGDGVDELLTRLGLPT